MARFILRRLVRALVTLILFQTILFLLIQAIPGDFVSTLLGIPSGLRQAMRRVMGLNALFTLMAVVHPVLMATVWQRVTYHPMVGFDYGPHPLPPSFRHLLHGFAGTRRAQPVALRRPHLVRPGADGRA